MEVRFKFSADLYIKGENMKEIRQKFESMPLFSADALEDGNAEFSELLLVENADTYEDLYGKFEMAYDDEKEKEGD